MNATAFLTAILENPDDDAPRLAYADWRKTHDDPERAEFIRVQCKRAERDEGAPLERWVGCYYIDRYGADASGGVCFRTASHGDRLLDTMSYGFAYQPNSKRGPFGRSSYSERWLVGDWYWFAVSDR